MAGTRTELQMIKMSEIQSQEVAWLWFPFIPYGKLTIVQGDPGDGKTTLVLNIAAKLSKGEGLDSKMKLTEPLNVIYQSAEDGLADTVKPRLEAAGANCENISAIDESIKSLSMIDERLETAIKRTDARVLILDPIQAYLGGTMDMNRANEARDMTKRLSLLAEKYKCAILLIGHMNKAGGNKAAYRGMGSIDFFAVARSVLLVGRIEGEPDLRAVVQIKNNLAAFGHSKAFRLTETGFEWIGDYEITADEVLGGIAPKVNKLEQAKKMLRELAETSTSVQSSEIFDMAEEDDFIFLDPPYDCVFNDYGNIDMMNGFDEAEHRRLAADFRNLPCRALMVIGKTPLTEELYGEYIFDEYYKNYSVNIKNRFNNDKMHIVVKNY